MESMAKPQNRSGHEKTFVRFPSYRHIIIAILVVFIGLGAYSIAGYGAFRTISTEGLYAYNNDDSKYIRAANTLINTGMLTYKYTDEPTVFIMPGIVFVLAPFVALFGQEGTILAFKIFQLLLQAFNLWLIWLIALRIFGKKVALLSLVICATYVANFYVVNVVLTEVIFQTLFLSLMLFTLKAFTAPSVRNYAISGVFWVLAILLRPSIAMFPIVILLIWIVKRYTFTDMLKYAGIVAGICVIVLAPWWIRNYIQFKQFIPLSLSSGNPMLQGTRIEGSDVMPEEEKALWDDSDLVKLDMEGLTRETQMDIVELTIAKMRIRQAFSENPREYLYFYTIGKTFEQWKEPFVWHNMFGLSRKQTIAQHVIIVLFFLIGLIFAIFDKKRNISWLFLFLVLMYFNCIHLPFLAFPRYIYPIMPIVIMFAAYSLIKITQTTLRVMRFVKN